MRNQFLSTQPDLVVQNHVTFILATEEIITQVYDLITLFN
jgi:hypothetical protein